MSLVEVRTHTLIISATMKSFPPPIRRYRPPLFFLSFTTLEFYRLVYDLYFQSFEAIGIQYHRSGRSTRHSWPPWPLFSARYLALKSPRGYPRRRPRNAVFPTV